MRQVRIVLLVLAGIIIILAVILFMVVRNLDALVKTAIERYGSEATGTSVQVRQVDIGLRAGRGEVQGLTVANPPGFAPEPIFRLDDITLRIDTGTITSDLPVVEEIRIGSPSFLYQVDAQGQANLSMIRDNLRQYSEQRERRDRPDAEPTRLLIRELTVEQGQGIVDLSAVGGGRHELTLPSLTLTDVGGAEGVTPEALGEAVIAALIRNLEQSAARREIEGAVRRRLEDEAGRLQEELERRIPEAGEALRRRLTE